MKELFEDAVLVYRQEADSFLTIVGVTGVVSLILLIVCAMGLTLALVMVPVFILLYLSAYSLCLQWAGSMSTSRMFGRGGRAWLELLARAPSILFAAGPGVLLALLVAASAVVAGHEGFWYLSVLDGLLGLFAGAQWFARHAYDQPLVIVFEAGAREAIAAGERLVDSAHEWTARLILLLTLPLVVAGVISAGLSVLMVPLAGAAIFVLALTVWLPFAALVLTGACQRLMDEQGALERLTAGSALP